MSDETKSEVIQPRILRGFRDYLPEEMRPRQAMIQTITEVFERFGFAPLQTPALEYADILLGKYGADAEKLLYRFTDNGGRDVCLRYDLTVPLARVAAQYHDLPKPLKRYQVAPVWRAEKPGRGRYREFFQCDVDIVGSSSLLCDAECVAVDDAVMTALGVENFTIRISTRKVLTALGEALGVESEAQLNTIFRTIDKLPSQGPERVRELMASDAGCSPEQIDLIMNFVGIEGSNEEKLARVVEVVGPAAEPAARELEQVLRYAEALGAPAARVEVDFSIARGLDYYTGTVYETFLNDLPGFGSVMSGGRYDGLITRFLGKPMPAVGISVGVDRLFAGLLELGLVKKTRSNVRAMVAAYDADCVPACLETLTALRRAGVASELAFDDETKPTLKKQMKAANAKDAPFVVILGPDEIERNVVCLKNMETREQETLPLAQAIERLRGA